MSTHRPWTGYLLAAIGVAVLLFQIGLYFYGVITGVEYLLYRPVSYVAMMLGFVGFYMIDRKGAEGGADILTRTVVAVISVIRTGKRVDDVKVEVTPVKEGAVVTVPQPVGKPHPDTDPDVVAALNHVAAQDDPESGDKGA